MSPSLPSSASGPATTDSAHGRLVAELTARWPEHRVAPSLGRIAALCELLGDPQRSYPVIHLTGTNGKGSTATMIETLLRTAGLRTGRFSSPHLMDVTERIEIDGRPISRERFAETWREIEPYVGLVDARQIDGVAMTFFEIITAMAYAAFADAPVDVAIVEVGLGGTWDATNVADAGVAVVTPIGLDHTHLLGNTVAEIAAEKAGIIKPGANAVLAGQEPEAAAVLLQRCADVGALVHREGIEFGVLERAVAVGGQQLRLNAAEGPVDDIFLPLHGAHQASNAALALAATEAFLGMKGMNPELVREGFAQVRVPGRLETVRRSPPVLLDAAHNPHGAAATAATLEEAFAFSPLIGVVAVMRDKDADGLLRTFEPVLNQVVITQVASTDRGMPAEELGELAEGIFGADRVQVVRRLDDAITAAVTAAEQSADGTPGVLVTGSVVAVGEARTLLVGDHEDLATAEAERESVAVGLDMADWEVPGADELLQSIDDFGEDPQTRDDSYGPEYGEQFDESELTEEEKSIIERAVGIPASDADGDQDDDDPDDSDPDDDSGINPGMDSGPGRS